MPLPLRCCRRRQIHLYRRAKKRPSFLLAFNFPSLYNHRHLLPSLSHLVFQESSAKNLIVVAATMMPTAMGEDHAAVPRVVSILSALLECVTERNDHVAVAVEEEEDGKKKKAVSAFQGLTKPAISVGGYLERIFRFAGCSPSCYVMAYIYLDRFLRRRPALAVDSFNVHRLLITSVLTAVKFVDDICYNNAYFARVGGISLIEMNYLEVDFLFGIAFDLNVTPAAFASYCAVLQTEMAYLEQPPPPPIDLLQHCLPDQEVDAAAATATGCHHHKQQQQLTV